MNIQSKSKSTVATIYWEHKWARRYTVAELEQAELDMRRVQAEWPTLDGSGFGDCKGAREWYDENQQRAERAGMLTPDALGAFLAARAWLRQFPKTGEQLVRSAWLKHAVEREVGYIANGTCIAAAVAEGFEIKRERLARKLTPNALIDISILAVDAHIEAYWRAVYGRRP
jgi:hypothetical protein